MRNILRFVKVIVLCLGIGLTAQDTFAHDATGKDTLGRITPTYLLVDTAADLPIDTVVKMFAEGKFQPVNREIINLPIKDSVVWLAFRRPLTDQARQYLSPGSESTIWRATLYTLDTVGQYQPYFHFDHLRSDTRPDGLPFRTVAIPLPDKLNDDLLLLRLAARRHRNYILKTGDLSTMSHYQLHKDTIPLIFIGFMLCIFIYNVFLFLSTRDIVFLPYLLYLLFVTYAVPFHNGYVLFSEEWMWQGNPFYTVWTGIGYLTGAIFAILYLDLKNTAPRFRVWIILLTFILVVIVPLLDVSRWFHVGIMAKIVSTTSLVFNLSLWFSGLYVWIKGHIEHAHYYVLGWLFAIAGMVLFIFSTNGIIPYTDFVEQSFFYGFAIEAVLFAFALGDRMNVLKKEKRALEVEYLDYTKEQNWLLAQQSFMNSHLLRAPLSRILGLLNLLKFTHSKEESDLYIEHIERSTVEMDGIAKKMSVMLEKEGYMNQYETEFNEVRKSIYEGNEEEQGDGSQQHNES